MKQQSNLLLLCFLACCLAYKLDTIASRINGDGLLANSTSLGRFETPQIDKRNTIYGCSGIQLKIIDGTTGILSTFSPTPWLTCLGGMTIDFDNDILYVGDSDSCRIFTVNLLTRTVDIFAGNGTCQQAPDGTSVFNNSIGTIFSLTRLGDGTLVGGFMEGSPTFRAINTSGFMFLITGDTISLAVYSAFGSRSLIGSPFGVPIAGAGIVKIDIANDSSCTIAPLFASSGQEDSNSEGIPVQNSKLFPNFLKTDSIGNIYVTENRRVRIIYASNSTVETVVGQNGQTGYAGDGSLATLAFLSQPGLVFFDSAGNIFVSDQAQTTIRRVDANSRIISSLGNGFPQYAGDGHNVSDAVINGPTQAVSDDNGDLFFADSHNNVIRKITAATQIITTVIGNGRIGFSPDGTLAKDATFESITGVAVTKNGDILFIDVQPARIRKLDKTTGEIITVAGSTPGTPAGDGEAAVNATFQRPFALAVDSQDNIFICDQSNPKQTVRRIDHATTIVSSLLGAQTDFCFGLTTDPTGNLYVSDGLVIFKVTPSGAVSTFAGNGEFAPSVDGTVADKSPLALPSGIAADIYGNIFFVESVAGVVKKIDAISRVISTVVANPPNVPNDPALLTYSKAANALIWTDITGQKLMVISDLNNEPVAALAVGLKSSWALLVLALFCFYF